MSQMPSYFNVLPVIPVLLAHFAGVVASVVLLIRQEERSVPAVLALVGFSLLLALDIANFARGPLINTLSHRAAAGIGSIVTSVGCCCSVFDAAAIACLIIAIWQALTGAVVEEVAERA